MADLTHLDVQTLRTFLQNDVAEFVRELEKIRTDDWAPALRSLLENRASADTLQENPFLAIGLMGQDDTLGGQALLTAVKDQAKAADGILDFQQRLFRDIDTELRETIDTLLTTQGASLEAIEAADFLDVLDGVDHTLSGGDGVSSSPNDSAPNN
ncbi:type VII secretion system-associated protein [Streptomyces sp. NPDC052721]|uniref:type VII secretion system-associated protein n=1 Tax=Streptomyces sp. NPDC052721 TaxID=3154955 RepID=UPI00344ADFB4